MTNTTTNDTRALGRKWLDALAARDFKVWPDILASDVVMRVPDDKLSEYCEYFNPLHAISAFN